MSNASKITSIRIVLSFIILLLLIFPIYQMGLNAPTYLFNNVVIDIRYIIAGVIFIIVSLLDAYDNYIAKREKTVSVFSNMFDEIAGLLLINCLLIILTVNGMISPIITIAIIVRDLIVDRMKFIISCYNKSYKNTLDLAEKVILVVGLTMTLFYNMPFELISLRISDFLLILATVLAVISGIKYYLVIKDFLTSKYWLKNFFMQWLKPIYYMWKILIIYLIIVLFII